MNSSTDIPRRIVFTGGPGFGKSSVLKVLEIEGFTLMPEAPRELVLEQRALAEGISPQKDFQGFAFLVADRMVEYYQAAARLSNSDSAKDGPFRTLSRPAVFYDRGLPDIFAYLGYYNHEIPLEIRRKVEVHRYEPTVFFFPDWEALYKPDGVRYESFEQARGIGRLIRQNYEDFGYDVVEVPRDSVESRVDFIRQRLESLLEN